MASDEFKGPYSVEQLDDGCVLVRASGGEVVPASLVFALLNRSPTGLTAWVPEGWELTGIHLTMFENTAKGAWTAILFNGPDQDAPMVEGFGPTPEDAVKDAAKKVKP